MTSLSGKYCLECEGPFRGRADKKFCSDSCRIAFNNRLNNEQTNLIRTINNILRRNRRILLQLNPHGKNKVSRDELNQRGFNFKYFTSTLMTKSGVQYFYCYEQGYLPLEQDQCLLIVKKDS
jgi:hypothetical protein